MEAQTLTQKTLETINSIHIHAGTIRQRLNSLPQNRDIELAKAKLEECVKLTKKFIGDPC